MAHLSSLSLQCPCARSAGPTPSPPVCAVGCWLRVAAAASPACRSAGARLLPAAAAHPSDQQQRPWPGRCMCTAVAVPAGGCCRCWAGCSAQPGGRSDGPVGTGARADTGHRMGELARVVLGDVGGYLKSVWVVSCLGRRTRAAPDTSTQLFFLLCNLLAAALSDSNHRLAVCVLLQ